MEKNFALITGASSGIGLEISKLLAKKHYNLVLVSNQQEALKDCKTKFENDYGVAVETICIDLARVEAAQEVYEICSNNNLKIEVLVNNAGFFFFGEAVSVDHEKTKQMILLHVLTSSMLCTLFGADMKKRRKGYILNNSSISAFKDFPGIAHYGSSKAYIKSFTRSLRTELKRYGVHVTCLAPGATATNLYDPNVINVERGKKIGVMMSASNVAKAGVKALLKNKALVIPGFVTKLMLFFAILTPHGLLYQISKRVKYFQDKDSGSEKKRA